MQKYNFEDQSEFGVVIGVGSATRVVPAEALLRVARILLEFRSGVLHSRAPASQGRQIRMRLAARAPPPWGLRSWCNCSSCGAESFFLCWGFRVFACSCLRVCLFRVFVSLCLRVFEFSGFRVFVCSCSRVYVCSCIRVSVFRVFVLSCFRVFMCSSSRVFVFCAFVPSCVRTSVFSHVRACVFAIFMYSLVVSSFVARQFQPANMAPTSTNNGTYLAQGDGKGYPKINTNMKKKKKRKNQNEET